MSRLQEVNLETEGSFLSWWKIVHYDPQERLEFEGQTVPVSLDSLNQFVLTDVFPFVQLSTLLCTFFHFSYIVFFSFFLTGKHKGAGRTLQDKPSSCCSWRSIWTCFLPPPPHHSLSLFHTESFLGATLAFIYVACSEAINL